MGIFFFSKYRGLHQEEEEEITTPVKKKSKHQNHPNQNQNDNDVEQIMIATSEENNHNHHHSFYRIESQQNEQHYKEQWYYFVNTIVTTILVCISFGLLLFSGFYCDFLRIQSRENDTLVVTSYSSQTIQTNTTIGIYCSGDFYYNNDNKYDLYDNDDVMWSTSRILFDVAMGMNSLEFIFTCFVLFQCYHYYAVYLWQLISLLSAVGAVIQIPIFLLYQIKPCIDYRPEQYCIMGITSYTLMASISTSVMVTIITQCLDPVPENYVTNLNQWRIPSFQNERSSASSRNHGTDRSNNMRTTLLPNVQNEEQEQASSSSLAESNSFPILSSFPFHHGSMSTSSPSSSSSTSVSEILFASLRSTMSQSRRRIAEQIHHTNHPYQSMMGQQQQQQQQPPPRPYSHSRRNPVMVPTRSLPPLSPLVSFGTQPTTQQQPIPQSKDNKKTRRNQERVSASFLVPVVEEFHRHSSSDPTGTTYDQRSTSGDDDDDDSSSSPEENSNGIYDEESGLLRPKKMTTRTNALQLVLISSGSGPQKQQSSKRKSDNNQSQNNVVVTNTPLLLYEREMKTTSEESKSSLGSLEPTFIEITAEESILDSNDNIKVSSPKRSPTRGGNIQPSMSFLLPGMEVSNRTKREVLEANNPIVQQQQHRDDDPSTIVNSILESTKGRTFRDKIEAKTMRAKNKKDPSKRNKLKKSHSGGPHDDVNRNSLIALCNDPTQILQGIENNIQSNLRIMIPEQEQQQQQQQSQQQQQQQQPWKRNQTSQFLQPVIGPKILRKRSKKRFNGYVFLDENHYDEYNNDNYIINKTNCFFIPNTPPLEIFVDQNNEEKNKYNSNMSPKDIATDPFNSDDDWDGTDFDNLDPHHEEEQRRRREEEEDEMGEYWKSIKMVAEIFSVEPPHMDDIRGLKKNFTAIHSTRSNLDERQIAETSRTVEVEPEPNLHWSDDDDDDDNEYDTGSEDDGSTGSTHRKQHNLGTSSLNPKVSNRSSKKQRRRRSSKRTKKKKSSSISVTSVTSLISYPIEEETEADIEKESDPIHLNKNKTNNNKNIRNNNNYHIDDVSNRLEEEALSLSTPTNMNDDTHLSPGIVTSYRERDLERYDLGSSKSIVEPMRSSGGIGLQSFHRTRSAPNLARYGSGNRAGPSGRRTVENNLRRTGMNSSHYEVETYDSRPTTGALSMKRDNQTSSSPESAKSCPILPSNARHSILRSNNFRESSAHEHAILTSSPVLLSELNTKDSLHRSRSPVLYIQERERIVMYTPPSQLPLTAIVSPARIHDDVADASKQQNIKSFDHSSLSSGSSSTSSLKMRLARVSRMRRIREQSIQTVRSISILANDTNVKSTPPLPKKRLHRLVSSQLKAARITQENRRIEYIRTITESTPILSGKQTDKSELLDQSTSIFRPGTSTNIPTDKDINMYPPSVIISPTPTEDDNNFKWNSISSSPLPIRVAPTPSSEKNYYKKGETTAISPIYSDPYEDFHNDDENYHDNEEEEEEEDETNWDELYLTDIMDVRLAELKRPEGAYKGPDEESL